MNKKTSQSCENGRMYSQHFEVCEFLEQVAVFHPFYVVVSKLPVNTTSVTHGLH